MDAVMPYTDTQGLRQNAAVRCEAISRKRLEPGAPLRHPLPDEWVQCTPPDRCSSRL